MGVAGTVFLVGALYAGDSRWLQRSDFSYYIEEERQREIKAEIRDLEYDLIEVEAKLRYEDISSERRATLEQKKEFLNQSIRELMEDKQ